MKRLLTLRQRVEAALFEAGYPNAEVHGPDDDPNVVISGSHGVPDRVSWKAFRVATGEDRPCYYCYNNDHGDECFNGNCMTESADFTT